MCKALEGDPEYAEALGTLTDSVALRTLLGWHESWSGGVDEASRLADRVVAVAPDNSTCLASAAFTYGVLSRRFDEAFDLANRAVALHPNSVLVRYRAGAVYAVCGEPDKAIAQCEAASRMNPFASKKTATATFSTLSCALYFAGRFEECIHAGRRALALAPQDTISRKYVAMSLGQLGHPRCADRDRRARQATNRRFDRTLPAARLSPQVDARAACGRPAQGGIAAKITNFIFVRRVCVPWVVAL